MFQPTLITVISVTLTKYNICWNTVPLKLQKIEHVYKPHWFTMVCEKMVIILHR